MSGADISRQVAAKRGRPEGLVSKAARHFGTSERQIRRAVKLYDACQANPGLREAIRAAGLDYSATALHRIAEADDPFAEIAVILGRGSRRKAPTSPLERLQAAWLAQSVDDRQAFVQWILTPAAWEVSP